MKKIIALIIFLLFTGNLFAQKKATRTDSIKVTTYIAINNKNVTTFLTQYLNDSQKLMATAYGDTVKANTTIYINGVNVTGFFNYLTTNKLTGTGIASSAIGYDNLTTTLKSIIDAGGTGSITNAADDTTIKENGSHFLYVHNFVGGEDTLTVNSATPNVSAAVSFVTKNTANTTVTNFLGNPGTSIATKRYITVGDNYNFIVTDNSNIDAGGISRLFKLGDKFALDWLPSLSKWRICDISLADN